MSFDEGYQAGTQGMAKAIDTAHLIGSIQERKRIIAIFQELDERNHKPCEHSPKGYSMPCGGCQYFWSEKEIIDLIEENK
jgi:hypothetical protein